MTQLLFWHQFLLHHKKFWSESALSGAQFSTTGATVYSTSVCYCIEPDDHHLLLIINLFLCFLRKTNILHTKQNLITRLYISIHIWWITTEKDVILFFRRKKIELELKWNQFWMGENWVYLPSCHNAPYSEERFLTHIYSYHIQ